MTAMVPHWLPRQTGVSHGPFGGGQSVIEEHTPLPVVETVVAELVFVVPVDMPPAPLSVPFGTHTFLARSHE